MNCSRTAANFGRRFFGAMHGCILALDEPSSSRDYWIERDQWLQRYSTDDGSCGARSHNSCPFLGYWAGGPSLANLMPHIRTVRRECMTIPHRLGSKWRVLRGA